jgi:hypothetical protein
MEQQIKEHFQCGIIWGQETLANPKVSMFAGCGETAKVYSNNLVPDMPLLCKKCLEVITKNTKRKVKVGRYRIAVKQ